MFRGRRASRTWTRLLTVSAIPLLGLSCFAGIDGAARWRTARSSEQLRAGVQHLATVTDAANLVSQETYLAAALAYGSTLHQDAAAIGKLIGTDPVGALGNVARQLDAELDRLPAGDPLLDYRSRITSIVREVEQGSGSLPLLANHLGLISLDVDKIADGVLDTVTKRALRADGSAGTRQALAVLSAAHQAAGAVYTQIGQLSGVVVNRDPSYLRTLRQATASLADAQDSLNRLSSGAVGAAWRALSRNAAVLANEQRFNELADADSTMAQNLGLADVGTIFSQGMARLQRYDDLAGTAARDAVRAAVVQQHSATDALRVALAATVLLIIVTLLMTAVVVRSVVRPLSRLRDGARRVSMGALDGPPVEPAGPYELREVTSTFGEVVANLRTVETQVAALATGELDDPTLQQPVPGRLGALLHASVGRLSRAMGRHEELTAQLAYEARHDALTSLPNRAAATEEVVRALARAQRAGTGVALLFVDLDGFKRVNDNLGHSAGDAVLRATSHRLSECVRAGDFAARVGGDEFLVITEQSVDAGEAVALGERIVEALSQPIAIGRGGTRIGASIGIAMALDGETDADRLLRDADLAVHRAKGSGRGQVEIFDDGLRAEVARSSEVELALREALTRDELELHFQPVVDLSGRVSGTEALLRWQRPGVGQVPPGDFIPVAETSDLIIDVGRWVLDRACRHLAEWSGDPTLRDLGVAVNLSGRHLLHLTVVDDVREALARHGVAPQLLTVEITETTGAQRPDPGEREPRRPARDGRDGGDRRLRDGIHLAGPPSHPAGRRAEDRPLHDRQRRARPRRAGPRAAR